jgi:hypothetical protein
MAQLSTPTTMAQPKATPRPKPKAPVERPAIPFPAPKVVNRRNFYPLGEVRAWRAAIAAEPVPEPQPDDERWLSSRQVRDLFGGVSDMWLWRRRAHAGQAEREQAEPQRSPVK